MAKKETHKKNTAPHSAYDDFIHSEEWTTRDERYDYTTYRSETAGRHTDAYERTATARPRKEKAPQAKPKERKLSDEYLQMKAQKEHAKKQKNDKNDHLFTLIAAGIITVLIFTFSILTLGGNVEQYSENENRYLAGRPELSASSLSDGKYMGDMENYLSDQFAGRSAMVKTRTALDVLCGKKEINGVYIGKDHYLFEKPAAYEATRAEKTIESVNTFSNRYKKVNTYFALAPDASDILAEYMPKNATNENQLEQIKTVYGKLDKSIKTIDIYTTLKNSNERQSLYYRTDHHWTTKAAEIAFKQIAANMKIDTSKVTHETYAVTNDFQGTLASSSGLFNAKDTIYITAPKSDIKYFVSYVEENKKRSTVFESSKLETKNKYEVFFGGNFAEVKIDTTLNSKKVLMVVKDSYANCLVPMLTPYYKTIIMIDPRYYHDNLKQLMKDEGVTDVLWLYNVNTFLTDTSIDSTF